MAPITSEGHAGSKLIQAVLLFEVAIAAAALMLGGFMQSPPWLHLHLYLIDGAWGLVATGPMLAGLVVCRCLRQGPFGELNRVVDDFVVPLFRGATTIQLVLISALAGVGEELLFRGVMQPVLIDWMGVLPAIAITSLIFGLAHLVTPLYGILAAMVSAYLGWLMLWQGNLLVPIVAHGMYDFLALVYLLRWNSRNPQQPDSTQARCASE